MGYRGWSGRGKVWTKNPCQGDAKSAHTEGAFGSLKAYDSLYKSHHQYALVLSRGK